MPYATVNGLDLHHDVTGSGDPVVLLHGGYCSAEVMRPIGDLLADRYTVHAPERAGHGRTADRPGPFSFDDMVADTIGWMDAIGLESAHLVGFSDGAITALLMARDHGTRVRSLVSIGGNIDETAWEGIDPDGPTDEEVDLLHREHAAMSPDGPHHGPSVMTRLQELWEREPRIAPASLGSITAPALVLAADRDVVSIDHTRLIAEAIPGAQLGILPGSGHLVVRRKPALVAAVVGDFLDGLAG